MFHLYLGKCGGIHPSRRIATIAESSGANVCVGERVPLGIGQAAHAHFAAALGTLDYPIDLSDDLNEHDLLVEPLERKNGHIAVPDSPGLGVEIDEDKLRYYSRDESRLAWR